MEVVSPNGKTVVQIRLDDKGRLQYRLLLLGRQLLDWSTLQWIWTSGRIREGLKLAGTSSSSKSEAFPLLSGRASQGREEYSELVVSLLDPKGRSIEAAFRACNDAMAFRWTMDVEPGDLLIDEPHEYVLPEDAQTWSLDCPNFMTSFEGPYDPHPISSIRAGQRKSLPLLAKTAHGAMLFHEAAVEDHAGAYLCGHPSKRNALTLQLSPRLTDDSGAAVIPPRARHTSPWRVVMAVEDPLRLIESTTLASLNPPCRLEDTSWIKPGKVTWDWWCGPVAPSRPFPVGMNTETFEYFIDFAAAHSLEYCMVDGGWYGGSEAGGGDDVTRAVPGLDLERLVQYGREKGVDILIWVHSSDLRRQLDEALAYYAAIGAKGLKIDFFDRYDQDVVAYCHEILEKAAARKLLINFHGVFSPVGWERTYPHLMTSEGVMGAEYNKWSNNVTPTHNLRLPFTRMAVGGMDYTVGVFENSTVAQFEPRKDGPTSMGTRAHNLAMYVVYESGLQMVSDTPDAIWGQPGSQFVAEAPAAWDETLALSGRIGEHIVVARRKGSHWLVGGMTSEVPRTLALTLEFMDRPCRAEIYRDGIRAHEDAKDLAMEVREVSPGDRLEFACAPAGGFALVLKPL